MFNGFNGLRRLLPGGATSETQRPVWKSRSLRVAMLALVIGSGLWIVNHDASRTATRSTMAGFSPDSPALFRLGGSFVGGFFIGLAFRRFVKTTALIAVALIAGLGLLKASGLIQLDWAGLEEHVRESFTWLQGRAEGVKTFLTGYLPSAGAGGAGVWKGTRWR